MILFTISNSCLIKELKERIKSKSQMGSGALSIIGSFLGIGTIQLCTVSGTCSINIVTSLLLGFFFIRHGIWIIDNYNFRAFAFSNKPSSI